MKCVVLNASNNNLLQMGLFKRIYMLQLCRNTRKGKKNAKQSKQIVHKIYLCDFQSGGFFWISSKQKWSIRSCDNSLRPKKMCFKRKVIKKVPVNFWGKKIKNVHKKNMGIFFFLETSNKFGSEKSNESLCDTSDELWCISSGIAAKLLPKKRSNDKQNDVLKINARHKNCLFCW